MEASGMRALLQRRVPRRGAKFLALTALTVAVLPMAVLRVAVPGLAAIDGAGGAVAGEVAHDLLDALGGALKQIATLQEQVEAGNIIPNFGAKAQDVLAEASSRAGPAAGQDVQLAIDGALQGLFLRQVALLGPRVAAAFEGAHGPQVASQADRQFVAEAEGLVRPGSGWSFERERSLVRAYVEGGLRNRAALVEERARGARLQQTTIDVIAKMQEKMESLARKVQHARSGGSPWVLSTSYRIPNTPLQLVGRYEQGRANVELNLTPQRDPGKSSASFTEAIGPANIGVSFNIGL